MEVKVKSAEYAQKVKNVLIQMAANDKLPLDMTQLDTTEIESIFEPVFSVLNNIETDAEMALDGSWDCTTEEGIEDGFNSQLTLIDSL